jgi:hypothetical protein
MAVACGRALQLSPRLGATRGQAHASRPHACLTTAIGNAEISGRTRYHWPYQSAHRYFLVLACDGGLLHTFEKHLGWPCTSLFRRHTPPLSCTLATHYLQSVPCNHRDFPYESSSA